MNILIITQMYPQPDDVGENKVTRTVEYFAKEWVNSGNRVIVIHCSSKFPALLYLLPKPIKDKYAYKSSNIIPSFSSRKSIHRNEYGIDIYRIPMFKLLPGRAFSEAKIAKTGKRILEILTNNSFVPDVVTGHFANPSLEIVSILGSHFHCKTSIVFHGDCNKTTIDKYRIKKTIPSIGAIGARSIYEARQIQGLLGLSEMPFICYSGVPDCIINNASRTCNKHNYLNGIKYLYVGSLISRKHLDTVIKAFSRVKESSDTLTIVGGGPEENSLRNLSYELGLKDQVIFVGRVDRNRVFDYMKESHVFTLVSDNEVFGMVYFEAMLQGCLTIASQNGGFDGIIIDGDNGFICQPGDLDSLVDAYKRIKRYSTKERNTIGNNAIKLAAQFSEKDVANRYLEEILKRNGENRHV